MTLAFQIFTSPIGEILVAGSGYAVTKVKRGTDKHQLSADFRLEHDDATPVDVSGYIREACFALAAYLEGRAKRVDVTVQVEGTEFQRKVWHELRQIPCGQTLSYSELAEAIGSPQAYRAVANACADNPVPLIVPCHRAVHKGGKHTGFGWGPDAKRYLLEMELRHTGSTQRAFL